MASISIHTGDTTPNSSCPVILITVAFETRTLFPPYFSPLKSCLSKLMSKFSESWNLGNAESRGK